MKKVFMIGLCLLVAGIIGCSKGSQEVEASGDWDPCSSSIGSQIWNSCIAKDGKKHEWGLGYDLIIHEGKDGEILNKVTGEYKWDGNNGEHKGYLVGTSKLADLWAKAKSLVNR